MIVNVSKLSIRDASKVGGKAANLGELLAAGFNVPKGFVVSPEANLIKEKSKILKTFKSLKLKKVSVRSSATSEDSQHTSFAGQFDTFLNVSEDDLLEKIEKCRDSIKNPRVKSYCRINNIDSRKIRVGVIVQEMINSDVSGVGFSINPVTLNRNEVIIEAVFGLGEMIVSGEVTPDSYIIEKARNVIISKILSSQLQKIVANKKGVTQAGVLVAIRRKQKLPQKRILNVSKTIQEIENHYKYPVDVEWAYEGRNLYILQSRPITNMGLKSKEMKVKSFEKKLKNGHWKEGSVWEFDWYIDVLFAEAMAFHDNPIFMGYEQAILGDQFLNPLNEGRVINKFRDFLKDKKRISSLLKKQRNIVKNAKVILRDLREGNINLEEYKKAQKDLSQLMASVSVVFDELISTEIKGIAEKNKILQDDIFSYIVERSSKTVLKKNNQQLIKIYRTYKEVFIKSSFILSKLPQIVRTALAKHAEKFGWLNAGEKGEKAWSSNDFLGQLKMLVSQKKKRKLILRPTLPMVDNNKLNSFIAIGLNDNVAADLQSELDFLFQKYLINTLGENYKPKIIENLTFEEIVDLLANKKKISDFIARDNIYRVCWPENEKLNFHYFKNKRAFQKIYRYVKSKIDMTSMVRGSVAYAGYVEGDVFIVKTLTDIQNFPKGKIMVASKTQPRYVRTMSKSIAIVTDIGGVTSHAAIISRELNIPCIVGTKIASKVLKTGNHIIVDANNGIVYKKEPLERIIRN